MDLKVFRYNPESGKSRYETFTITEWPGMTVLGALFKAQENYDQSLAFRYSCRGAVCGTCTMLINKVPRLACRTQVEPLLRGEQKIDLHGFPAMEEKTSWDEHRQVLVEPLPNLPVIKDLVVDMESFFSFYRKMDPTLRKGGESPDREYLMNPGAVKMLEVYTACILCGACFGACPVDGKNPRYIGPAALAKLYRFHIDPREPEDEYRLALADLPEGWWACEFHDNCRKVCPKGVPPIQAIGKARKEITERRNPSKEEEKQHGKNRT
jgi:succinate dehydrogenase/fumarate reductase iron-sulfur protein